jgi:hypothetical protein
MPCHTVEVDLSDDGYPDFHATARLNVPLRLGDDFRSGLEDRARAAALIIFPKWDFVDEDGKDIPHTAEGIGMIPQDLFVAMLTRWAEALEKWAAVPKATAANSSPTLPSEPEGSEAP